MTKAGKPLTRLGSVKLVDIDIVTNIGTHNATKLNVILESNQGNRILVTSGIQTWWTTCVIAGLFGLLQNGLIDTPFNLDSYRGNKVIFASIRSGQSYSDQDLYALLKSDRTDKAWDAYESTVSSIVDTLKKELNTTVEPDTSVEAVDVQVEETAGEEF